MIVIDASVALAYLFPDETTPAVLAAMDILLTEKAVVPAFWHTEVANSLEMAVRRKRIAPDYRDAMLIDLRRRPVRVDEKTHLQAWTGAKQLAERHRLTLYDAAYLEVAMRLNSPLATLDKELRRAAETEGVVLLGL